MATAPNADSQGCFQRDEGPEQGDGPIDGTEIVLWVCERDENEAEEGGEAERRRAL